MFAFLWLHCFHLKLRTDEDEEGQQGHLDDVHHKWSHYHGSICSSAALVENIGFQVHSLLESVVLKNIAARQVITCVNTNW